MHVSHSDYGDIFEQRGDDYHEAMRRVPGARHEEFRRIVALAAPREGELLVDMPSGGGYLRSYLAGTGARLIAVESSEVFHRFAASQPRLDARHCALEDVPLASGSVDAVVSLAGLHHVEDRPAVFREIHRLLRPGGRFCLADVEAGSAVDGFLNDFVHNHNSMGHEGWFIDGAFREGLAKTGFEIERDEQQAFRWTFDDPVQMSEYCRLLFGVDRASVDDVLGGIERWLGYESDEHGCRMHWLLTFIRCRKPE